MNEVPPTQQSAFFPRVETFVRSIVDGIDLDLDITVEDAGDHVLVNLTGGDGEPLLRRKGEALDALQHLVNTVFRHEADEKRLVVDCHDFRKARDRELRQMVRFLIDRARSSGLPQQIGPLNSYSRRLVHLEVAEAGDMESTSEGVGATKRVTICAKRPGRE
jgi:spoIIIJ-associated protein